NCHKWLLAPTGAGFLHVGVGHIDGLRPLQVSWGWRDEGRPPDQPDEHGSTPRLRRLEFEGTRDCCPWLAVPRATDFQAAPGLAPIRACMRQLADYTREQLTGLRGLSPATPAHPERSGAMTAFHLPAGVDSASLRRDLWEKHRIELPVIVRPDRL